jgi:hypothetical protein
MQVGKLGVNERLCVIRKALKLSCEGQREELLSGIVAVSKLMESVADVSALSEIICAIDDSGRWWP